MLFKDISLEGSTLSFYWRGYMYCIYKGKDFEMANTEMTLTGNDKMKLLLSYAFTRRGTLSYKIMKCIF